MGRIGDDIIPSFLGGTGGDAADFYDGNVFGNFALRLGEVNAIIKPSDERSVSKKFLEYDVYTQHRANQTAATFMYSNVIAVNPFAGLADKAVWTYRASGIATKKGPKIGHGSKVLLLCVQGETANAVIIGGIRDQDDAGDTDEGHHLRFVFNGVTFEIDKDGALAVIYGGKTDIDGKLASDVDSSLVGTRVAVAKDGTFRVEGPGGKQTLVIDNTAKKVVITHQNGVHIGAATDSVLLGTAYRNAESAMFNQLRTGLSQIQGVMAAVITGVTTASTAISVILPPVGVALAPVIAGLTTTTSALASMVSAISTFEAKASTYLSQKNKTD